MARAKVSIWLILLVSLCGLGFWAILLQQPRLAWLPLLAVLPAAWAAWDSRRICVQEYYTSLAVSPSTLFLLVLLCWVVVLPWYLSVRDLIRTGRALRRPRENDPSPAV